MAFNDSLDFAPNLEKLAAKNEPFHVLLSGYLRQSRTFELYDSLKQVERLDAALVPFELPDDGSPDIDFKLSALMDLFEESSYFRSILVSDPYKRRLQHRAHKISAEAEACGAVNVLFKKNEIVGENIDGLAFRRGAEEHEGVIFDGKAMLFFGCGGVSSAVAVRLADSLAKIGLLDLDESRAVELKQLLQRKNPHLLVEILQIQGSRDFRDYDYLYNGTGLGKYNSNSPITEKDRFRATGIAFDANYTPAKTPFLKQMEQVGHRSINGLSHMLMCTTHHLQESLHLDAIPLSRQSPLTFAIVFQAYQRITLSENIPKN